VQKRQPISDHDFTKYSLVNFIPEDNDNREPTEIEKTSKRLDDIMHNLCNLSAVWDDGKPPPSLEKQGAKLSVVGGKKEVVPEARDFDLEAVQKSNILRLFESLNEMDEMENLGAWLENSSKSIAATTEAAENLQKDTEEILYRGFSLKVQQDISERKLQEFQSLHRFQAGIHSKTREKQNKAQGKALANFKARKSIAFRLSFFLLQIRKDIIFKDQYFLQFIFLQARKI
jgi:hypothetical protein